ncbi:hypothetical protein QYE87_24265, partial [Enterobacter hormaechei subsp. steigerwaltii]|nr:hypothetical protein [Enterobacter hormaechei subsp. steigerwaltii]
VIDVFARRIVGWRVSNTMSTDFVLDESPRVLRRLHSLRKWSHYEQAEQVFRMGSCAAPSAKGDDKFITTDYLQQCPQRPIDPVHGK